MKHILNSSKMKSMIQRVSVLLLLSVLIDLSTTSLQAQITVVNERGINTPYQEYSPAFYPQGLVFIASNPVISKDKKETAQFTKPATSLFFAKRGHDGNLQRPIIFGEELTTKFYDGPLSFNEEGNIVFFTRANLKKGKPKAGADAKVHFKIFTSRLNPANGKWEQLEELPFCSNDYDCMHPSVSADGQRLYFASNRSGGKGGLDLYVSFNQNGKWTEPANLGPSVNTTKDEITPFIHKDNTLYFASNGFKGLGGVDIFWTKKTDKGWLAPELMSGDINSTKDDFGLIVSNDKKTGFFTSNRSTGQGDDDIFSFSDKGFPSQHLDTLSLVVSNQDKQKSSKVEIPVLPITDNRLKEEVKKNKKEIESLTESVVVVEMPTNIKKNEDSDKVYLEISAIDKTTNLPMAFTNINVLNMKSIKNATFMTDAMGKVTGLRAESGANIPLDILPSQELMTDAKGLAVLKVKKEERFIFNFSKEGYEPKYIVKTASLTDNKIAAFMLKSSDKIAEEDKNNLKQRSWTRDSTPYFTQETDFGEFALDFEVKDTVRSEGYIFELKTTYYAENDAEVREPIRKELAPLLKMMQKDLSIEIEIASHTAAKGKEPYNITISQLRADNIKTYFVENGIEPNRIRSFGLGETLIRNRCKRGVNCSQQEHAYNLRTLIKVVKGADAEVIKQSSKIVKVSPTDKPSKRVSNQGTNYIADNTNNAYNLVASSPASKRYYVVIGTFTKPENAQKHCKKAIEAGFVEAEVIQYQDTYLYGVSVRLLNDIKEAHKLVDYINNQKEFEAFVKEWR